MNLEMQNTEDTAENVILPPAKLYIPEIKENRKVYDILKRGIDIVGGLFGLILLIPITIRNIYSTKNI